jgi:hypothetical protein
MMKGYLYGPVPKEYQEGDRPQVQFCTSPDEAGRWSTRESAEIDRDFLNRGIEINSAAGGKYMISDFEVEQLGPDHYVLFTRAPFIVRDDGKLKPMGNRVGNG